MNIFLQNNWFKISFLLILGLSIFGYYKNIFTAKLYNINSDCAEKAQLFAKEKSTDFIHYTLIQNTFNKGEMSCFAELSNRNSEEIYDLTHNKKIYSFITDILYYNNDSNFYVKTHEEYLKIKLDIFGR